ncbi:MAG: tyrosine-type recombinase/integrase, partial [Vicinamibacteraceae bacterium]
MTMLRTGAVTASAPRVCVGPLAPYIDRFAEVLTSEGYASETVRTKCAWVAAFSHWLTRRGRSLASLDDARITQFHRQHRRDAPRRGDVATGRQLLAFLRDLGVSLPPRPHPDRSALGRLLREYERFLRSERGLARSTIVGFLAIVRRFLTGHFKNRPLHLQDLRPPDLHRFVLREAHRVSRTHARTTVTTLRSFLRFLRQRGAIDTDLAAALPGVAQWRWAHLPKALPPEQVECLLRRSDRRTPAGQRDYAILLLLARLGLRGGEVRALTLDDVDWARGEILVRGKGPRCERLPLPKEVGTALVHYLRHARPACATRTVFVRLHAPRHGLRLSAVCCVVRRALRRAGLNPAFKGAHLLRHYPASRTIPSDW